MYELGQLGMKFERHLDAEVVDFQVCTCHAPQHAQSLAVPTAASCREGLLTSPSPSYGDSTRSATDL